MLYPIKLLNRSPSQQQDYEQTAVGSVRRVTDNSTEIHLGKLLLPKRAIFILYYLMKETI